MMTGNVREFPTAASQALTGLAELEVMITDLLAALPDKESSEAILRSVTQLRVIEGYDLPDVASLLENLEQFLERLSAMRHTLETIRPHLREEMFNLSCRKK